jgi:DNA-binding transcriptional LysR family regulator
LKLFDHKGRKLELTAQGEIFYVEAKKVLNSVEEAKEKAKIMRPISAGKSLSRLRRACVILSAELCPVPGRVPRHQVKDSRKEPC